MPVDPAALAFIGPSTPSHMAFDLGATTGGRFFSIGTGIVTRVEFNTGQGLPGTNYRVWIDYTSTGIFAVYHFEIDGSVPEQSQRDNLFVAEGDRVTPGQHIGNLFSRGGNAHVHFSILESGGIATQCPLNYFSSSIATELESVYDGDTLERRSPLSDLCNSSELPNPQLPATQTMTAVPIETFAVTSIVPYGQTDRQFETGIRFGTNQTLRVFSVGDGIVHSVEAVNPDDDITYRIRVQVTQTMLADYVFDVDGSLSNAEKRSNMLVSVGDTVTAGQHIGTLPSQGPSGVLFFQFFDFNVGFVDACPLDFFSPSVAAQLEALYDSVEHSESPSRADLCP